MTDGMEGCVRASACVRVGQFRQDMSHVDGRANQRLGLDACKAGLTRACRQARWTLRPADTE